MKASELHKEGYTMKKQKHCFTYEEWRFLICAMNRYRNALIGEGRYTDTVDDVLCKLQTAKTKKVEVS
jgi:hypothetical protein